MSDTTFVVGEDTILYGDELLEGMEVKRERSYLLEPTEYATITKLRKYTTTDSGSWLSSVPVTRHHIAWVAVFENRRQESFTTTPEAAWIVLDSSRV